MNNLLTIAILSVLCLGGLILVVGGLIAFLLLRRRPDYSSVAALEAFDHRVVGWAHSGRLPSEIVAQVRTLIAADRAQLLGWAPPVAGAGVQEPKATPTPTSAQPIGTLPLSIVPEAAPVPEPATIPEPLPLPPVPSIAPKAGTQPLAVGRRTPAPGHLLSALMALATRRTLLFLGSFLLAVSALTLVVFNWASFPPLIQLGILASVVGGLWAGGSWMIHRPDLATPGQNLQAVAGLLVPVVAFALTRPGLLDMAPRASWLTVSLLSLPIYLLAAWRTGRGFYSTSAALAGVSALLAAQFGASAEWLAAPLVLLLIAYLALAAWLRAQAAALAVGPRWVAHIALPIAVAGELLLTASGMAGSPALSTLLGLATIFYVTATWLDPRPVWATLAALLLPAAICLGLDAASLPAQLWPPALAALALGYLGFGVALEGRKLTLAQPILLIAPLLAGAALLASLTDPDMARNTLPLLVAFGAALAALIERGQLAWVGPRRYALATAGLAAVAVLLPGWLLAMLDLSELSIGVRGLILTPLAAAYFAGARWWPGRVRRSYDTTLQSIGALLALVVGTATLFDERTWVPGAALLALVWGFQATLRKGSLWAALALGSALMAGGLALLRAPELSAVWWIWAGVSYAALYAIGGSLLRQSQWGHWTWPAIGWATVTGTGALTLSAVMILMEGSAGPSESLAILALSATLALMTWIWRRGWPGYPAAALLVLGTLLAADRGFYTGWVPAEGDIALIACALAATLGLLGQWLRARAANVYALPYEQVGLALLTAAPLLAGGDSAHLCLAWLSMGLLYALAAWRYRAPWMLAAAWLSLDLGLLRGAAWLLPGGPVEGASLILLAAVALQALLALWAHRSITALLLGVQRIPVAPSYTAAVIGGAGALLLASSGDSYLAGVALGLAAIMGVVAVGELSALASWGSLALLALGLGSLHSALSLSIQPSLAWGLGESLILYGIGWASARLPSPRWQIWREPLRVLPTIVGLTLGLALALLARSDSSFGYLAISLGGVGLLLALVARREGQPWLYTAALTGADLAALALALWRFPALSGPQLAPLMLVSAAAQAASAIWLRGSGAGGRRHELGLPLYAATVISGTLALGLAYGDRSAIVIASLGLAIVAGAAAWFERREAIACLSVGLAALAALSLPAILGVTGVWGDSWVIIELLGVLLIGWGLERANGAHWRRPSSFGPLGLMLLSLLGVAVATTITGGLPPLTFALASAGLLLATLAVRLRAIGYGYAAGAALVAAGMCQLADWGVRDLQGYVLPAGLYLLALSAGLRRFQGQRKVSQVIEAGAAMLMLGVTLGQALRDGGALYELLICGEALAVAAYGTLLRLRVPFIAGVSFFIAGVLWAAVDNVRITNQWVLFGTVGLLMIAAYVLLERYQERLLRAGRAWASELRAWG